MFNHFFTTMEGQKGFNQNTNIHFLDGSVELCTNLRFGWHGDMEQHTHTSGRWPLQLFMVYWDRSYPKQWSRTWVCPSMFWGDQCLDKKVEAYQRMKSVLLSRTRRMILSKGPNRKDRERKLYPQSSTEIHSSNLQSKANKVKENSELSSFSYISDLRKQQYKNSGNHKKLTMMPFPETTKNMAVLKSNWGNSRCFQQHSKSNISLAELFPVYPTKVFKELRKAEKLAGIAKFRAKPRPQLQLKVNKSNILMDPISLHRPKTKP